MAGRTRLNFVVSLFLPFLSATHKHRLQRSLKIQGLIHSSVSGTPVITNTSCLLLTPARAEPRVLLCFMVKAQKQISPAGRLVKNSHTEYLRIPVIQHLYFPFRKVTLKKKSHLGKYNHHASSCGKELLFSLRTQRGLKV